MKENWLEVVKDRAKIEAEYIIDDLRKTASHENVDEDWFMDEVIKNIRMLKGVKG